MLKKITESSFCEELKQICEELEVNLPEYHIYKTHGEFVEGECGEILEKEELREDFEAQSDTVKDYESFSEFWETETSMGGYFWRCVCCFFSVLLDGLTMEDDKCRSARFSDLGEAIEEATAEAERRAKYDYSTGEWKQPKIAVECFFCE